MNTDEILRIVKRDGKIKDETFEKLKKALNKAGYDYHMAIETLNKTGSLLKVIFNEKDALETIKNIEKQYGKVGL